MRIFIISAALALGSVALLAATPPPATRPVSTATSPAMSKALSLCHMQQGIGRTCVSALVNALAIEQTEHAETVSAGRALPCRSANISGASG